MGHFGRKPIRVAGSHSSSPALRSVSGAGRADPGQPRHGAQPFLSDGAEWFLLPLVLLATVATVIASQAVITGAFSLTAQAVQLACCRGLKSATLPRRKPGRSICRRSTACCLSA